MSQTKQKEALKALVLAQRCRGSKQPLVAKLQERAACKVFQVPQLVLATPRQKLAVKQSFGFGDGDALKMAGSLVGDKGRDSAPDGGRLRDRAKGTIFDFDLEIAGAALGLFPTTRVGTEADPRPARYGARDPLRAATITVIRIVFQTRQVVASVHA
jgi:hypothetical protein